MKYSLASRTVGMFVRFFILEIFVDSWLLPCSLEKEAFALCRKVPKGSWPMHPLGVFYGRKVGEVSRGWEIHHIEQTLHTERRVVIDAFSSSRGW
jgi:hypothetical protein